MAAPSRTRLLLPAGLSLEHQYAVDVHGVVGSQPLRQMMRLYDSKFDATPILLICGQVFYLVELRAQPQ